MRKTLGAALLAGATGAGLMAVPVAASADPALSAPLAPCYQATVPGPIPSITVAVSGGTPSGQYQVSIGKNTPGDGSFGYASGTFDANGNATATISKVFPDTVVSPTPGNQAYVWADQISASGDADTLLGTTLLTNRSIDLGPSFIDGQKPRTLKVSGTALANQKIYGFIVHRGKVLRKFAWGTGNACGYATKKLVLIPRHSPTGAYVLYANAGPKLNKKTAVSKAYKVEQF